MRNTFFVNMSCLTYFTLSLHFVCLIITVHCKRVSLSQENLQSTSPFPYITDTDKDAGVEYAAVKLLNTTHLRQFRKRPANVVQYQITLDNETFSITLRPNKNLFTPGCLVHRYLPYGKKDIYPCTKESVDCYYTGHSDTHQDSWVAANVCYGLNGVISFENTSLLIAPAQTRESMEGNEGHVHLVYRFQGDKQICPINDLSDSVPDNELHVVYGRKKRSTLARYIETRVVVDPTMYLYHRSRGNAIAYTLMAFNIASKLYTHPSIGTNIYLTLSELHVIETYNEFASELTENANKTLKTFCDWQSGLATKQVDSSVLLTRLDLEDENGNKGINGLAHLNKMCDKNAKCAIVEDEGPIMGITLAHEIGHLLGMTHDDSSTSVGIMSAGGWSGNEAFTWSSHSASELQRSLSSNRLKCLDNKPSGFSQNRVEFPLPGTLYTADQQCQMRTNYSYMFYRSTYNKDDPCINLKCKYEGSDALVFSSPLLDGTDCNNTRMWCIRGECVPIDRKHRSLAPVDGSWSSWEAEYTACSRTCGGGVQIKRRYCNSPPPQYGGNECLGLSTTEKICNIQECSSDYRLQQCSKSSAILSNPIPAFGDIGDLSCNISCQSDRAIMLSTKNYLDGTECLLKKSVPYSRCVQGKCQEFGCDWLSNSRLRYDECGICNGTGTTCSKVTGTYNESGSSGSYTNVTTIPAGSSDIRIQQTNRYCMLSMLVNGHRVLNDGMRKSGSALFNLYGIQLRYLNDRQNGETLEIVGKIEKSIVVQILRFYDYRQYAGVTPNMSYTYHIPSPHSSQSYAWAELPNQSCSRSCGSGVKSKTIKCMSIRGEFVDDYHCGLENKPKQTFSKCNTQACPPTWKVSDWGPCSVECGTGIKSRTLQCVSMVNGVDQAIPSSKCDEKLKPHNTSSCENLCTWKPGMWSKCTRTCGEGYRTRELFCVQSTGADVEINATLCDQDSKPVDTIRCRNDPCFVLPGTCVDKRLDCKKYYDYQSTACDGKYRNWMFTNCLKTCGVCRNGSCVDENSCQRVDQSVDACNNPSYKVWMHAHCPESCNLCRDCADCSKYDPKYCTDSQYRGFMAKNCRKYCKLC